MRKYERGLTSQNFLSSQSNLYLADISGLVFHIFYFTFCVYESNGVESPIHLLLHCLTPPEQGCGELFSLDKSNGKVTGVPNHRVKNISLPLSQPLALACSLSFSISVANKTKFRKKKSVFISRAGLFCDII